MNPPDIHEFSDLIRQRWEELTNEDQLGVGAQKVVELDQQSVGRLSPVSYTHLTLPTIYSV